MNGFDPGLLGDAFYRHGGRLTAARVQFPNAIEPWIDLSTGISPWAYPIPELPVECWTKLPDPLDLEALAAVARTAYTVPRSAYIVPIAGSDLGIGIIPRLISEIADVAVVAPTYSSHTKAWRAGGHRVREVTSPDLIQAQEIGVVVNPNNPDGRQWPASMLHEVSRRLTGENGFLIVDEAFCEVAPQLSVLSLDADLSRLVVLRSFGKFYGLAGVRLGFCITGHSIGRALASALSDWPVSGPAIAIGRVALADANWKRTTINRLEKQTRQLNQVLENGGFDIIGGTSLFRLARHRDARAIFRQLAEKGILVRPFAQDDLLRFGLPANDAELTRLRHALAG